MKIANILAFMMALEVADAAQGAVEITMNGDPNARAGAKVKK